MAIISHDSELTLITCSQTTRTQDNKFICQHQKWLSDVSQVPRATLIQDLQKRSCCVYTLNPDGTRVLEEMEEGEASGTTLTELRPEDFGGLTGTGDEQVNNSKPDDLGLYEVDEDTMLQLLPPEALASTSGPSQQSTSTSGAASFSLATSTSAASNQGASTSAQALSLTALLTQPQSSINLTPEQKIKLDSLMLSHKRTIYCLIEILENQRRAFTKAELIALIKEKYTNFDHIRSVGSCFNHAFSYAVGLNLIQKSARHAGINTLTYTRKIYGPAALEYLKQEVAPTLILRHPEAAHSNDGQ